ncbi:hypothetical protein [Streptomyces sp. NPDC048269]|uniref:hypothetical protein n=1 Tax=Streptomyces sp. NPDC048269 TaxID=3155753 RepID=UPI0034473184
MSAGEARYSEAPEGAPSPGYTGQQRERVRAFERRMRRPTALVITDPFWVTVEREKVVEARMALKRVHVLEQA